MKTGSVISVRPLEAQDHERIVSYFLDSDKDFLTGMGVDIPKLPPRAQWLEILKSNFEANLEQKEFYYIIWLLDNQPVGHSNINKIMFGEEAYLHLHMWKPDVRQKGLGLEFVKLSIPFFFDNFKLNNLYCEPYAKNPAPNKTLHKLGFELLMAYETTPGWISFHQLVNRWRLSREKFEILFPTS